MKIQNKLKALIEFTPNVIKYGRNNKDFNWRNSWIKIIKIDRHNFEYTIKIYKYSKKLLKELEKMKIYIEDGRPNVNGVIISKYPTKETPLFPKLNISNKSSLSLK